MPLIPGQIANSMKAFITNVNKMKQADAAKAIDAYCKQIEASIFKAIKGITITIQPGFIAVEGSSGPSANAAPIVINNVVT